MTEYHMGQLAYHRVNLVQNMMATEVINILQGQKVLTPTEADHIRQASGNDAQNEALLDCLLRKPDSAFEKFRGSTFGNSAKSCGKTANEMGVGF